MRDMQKLHEFAIRYYVLYENPDTTEREVEDGFADICFAFGFKMDCGNAFIEIYSEEAFYNTEVFEEIIDNVDDVMLLGSVIFSKWRCITHWDYIPDLLSEDSRKWFMRAFSRLAVLASDNEKINDKPSVKYSDSKSDVQVEIEAIMLPKIQKELCDDTIVKPERLPIDKSVTVYICPDFYSEENRIIGEIHAHIGRLKGAQSDKIASDVLKMLLLEKEQGIQYKKYIAVCDQDEHKQLSGKSALAESIRVFGIELLFISIPEKDYERLQESIRKQNLLVKS